MGLSTSLPSPARVGETQGDFEHRLLQPSIGRFALRDKNPDPIKEAAVARQQPFNQVRSYFPPDARERKYWKSAVPNVLSNENGWDVHVFFQNDRSILEAYQRVGDTLSSFEVQNILRANQGGSEWRKLDADSLEAHSSAIGCDYQLADGTLRAKVTGNWLMVYSTKLDNYVKEQIRLGEETQASQQQERLRQQQLQAPASTAGF